MVHNCVTHSNINAMLCCTLTDRNSFLTLKINFSNIVYMLYNTLHCHPGNEKAYQTANSALNLPVLNVTAYPPHYHYPLPDSDITSFIQSTYLPGGNTYGIICNIYPSLPVSIKHFEAQLSRQEQTLYSRLRIAHTSLTHFYVLIEDPPLRILVILHWLYNTV